MAFSKIPSGDHPEDASQPDTVAEARPRRRHEQAHAWAATLAGVVALALSIYNLVALQREPAVDVALPHITRVAQGKDTWLYFQPTLSTRVKTERVEVINQVEFHLQPAASGTKAPAFFWDETGSFSYNATAHNLTYQRVADPSPLLVSQSTPQQPLLLFNAVGWGFAEGRYEGTLVLRRASGKAPLRKSFCMVVSKGAAATMRGAGQYQFHDFRDDVPGSDARKAESEGCYVLSPV
ncbi:hypothetical protein [Streptomyces hiroshimensis]|uniref:Uncharacterized protein n=1 Tax=Streptomyces hiroshimensis TaxID=66424 RepID=A0ABQ2ZCA2_9ACTN|nr:hypothetical protein [Streptomyces hiroshimensis]GGY07839.1 hypothetical protein GCM10010324_63400 [Streptomyces hiroshimensis]